MSSGLWVISGDDQKQDIVEMKSKRRNEVHGRQADKNACLTNLASNVAGKPVESLI